MPCAARQSFASAAGTGNALLVRLKANQPSLHRAIARLCAGHDPLGEHATVDRHHHGREEHRPVESWLDLSPVTEEPYHVGSSISAGENVRTRWVGRQLDADVGVVVDGAMSVGDGQSGAHRFGEVAWAHLPALSTALPGLKAAT